MILNMSEQYSMMRDNHIDIIYSGPVWADGLENIADSIKKRLHLDNLPLTTFKSVYSVFIEQMNNILLYSAEKHWYTKEDTAYEIANGLFVLSCHDHHYFLQSGNPVQNRDVDLIKNKIDTLNAMDPETLKKHYNIQIRKENPNPNSRGAGVGLIEIARRAGSKLLYEFTPIDENTTFFSMTVEIIA